METPTTTQVTKQDEMNPAQLLTMAVDKDLDIGKLEKLMELQRQWETRQAQKSFFAAFTDFQMNCPDIRKTKQVGFETKTGGSTSYSYAPLADICRQINKVLKDNNLSYRWEIQDDEKTIKVTCIISHIDGHSERTTMQASPDTSGSKNGIQARGSAIEYLKRYTLIGALGISTADSDIDGRMGDYEYDVDRLHKEFMGTYNQVIQMDSSLSKWHPDNWLIEKTGKSYVKAIGDIRKVLFDLQKKHA